MFNPFYAVRNKLERLREKIELSRHDRFTIVEYFRRQGAQIGEGCSIIPVKLADEPYLVKIGNHVTIASGVTLVTHDGGTWLFRDTVPDLQVFGTIIIEDNCVIGHNATIFPNVRVGRNSIVGAGSVVISDVPPDTIVMGVPARPFGSVEKYREKCLERWNEQRPADIVIEKGKDWWTSRYLKKNREKLKRHLISLFWNKGEN